MTSSHEPPVRHDTPAEEAVEQAQVVDQLDDDPGAVPNFTDRAERGPEQDT